MFKIDGKSYDVPIISINRSFETIYKYNIITNDGVEHSEVKARYVNYTIVCDGLNDTEYYNLINDIFVDVVDHIVELPYNGETITLTCKVTFGGDRLIVDSDGSRIWNDLTINFESTKPIGA